MTLLILLTAKLHIVKKNSLILEWLNFRESWQNGVLQNWNSANFDISNLFQQPFKSKCFHFNHINSILQRLNTQRTPVAKWIWLFPLLFMFGMIKYLLAETINWSQYFANFPLTPCFPHQRPGPWCLPKQHRENKHTYYPNSGKGTELPLPALSSPWKAHIFLAFDWCYTELAV